MFKPMTPDQIANYRDNTRKWGDYNLRTRSCPGCKRTRSLAQFDNGRKLCRRCRGL